MKLKTFNVFILSVLLVFKCAFSDDSSTGTTIRFLPGLSWVLEINSPDFALTYKDTDTSGNKARFLVMNKKTGVMISGFLEKAPKKGTSKDCRSYYWKRKKRGMKS